MNNKMGRPKKHPSEVKKPASIRLSDKQASLLLELGKSQQYGLDNLLNWLKDNIKLVKEES